MLFVTLRAVPHSAPRSLCTLFTLHLVHSAPHSAHRSLYTLFTLHLVHSAPHSAHGSLCNSFPIHLVTLSYSSLFGTGRSRQCQSLAGCSVRSVLRRNDRLDTSVGEKCDDSRHPSPAAPTDETLWSSAIFKNAPQSDLPTIQNNILCLSLWKSILLSLAVTQPG